MTSSPTILLLSCYGLADAAISYVLRVAIILLVHRSPKTNSSHFCKRLST